jgi:hypothetical protein
MDRCQAKAHTANIRSRMDELLPLGRAELWLDNGKSGPCSGNFKLCSGSAPAARETGTGGVYRMPYFLRIGWYSIAKRCTGAPVGVPSRKLAHQTALGVYGICDVNSAQVHLTVPKDARLRRRKPKWILIHRGDLLSSAKRVERWRKLSPVSPASKASTRNPCEDRSAFAICALLEQDFGLNLEGNRAERLGFIGRNPLRIIVTGAHRIRNARVQGRTCAPVV